MTIITQGQYKVIYADGFGYRKDIMEAATKHQLDPVSLSAARANKRAGKHDQLCPAHDVASTDCHTAWGIDTGDVARYSFPCGCTGVARIAKAKS